MLRPLPAFLGLGLILLWTLGLFVDATPWLAWAVLALGVGCVAATGLIPETGAGMQAAVVLALISGGLLALFAMGLDRGATSWLVWWTFVFGALTAAVAMAVAAQGRADRARVRRTI